MKKTVFCLGKKENYTNYYNALIKCNATPVFSTNIEEALSCDCLLLMGGDDLNPKLYNEENTASMGIDDLKDSLETELLRMFSENSKPILGICRGLQLINVAFGGSLIQHIDTASAHSRKTEEPDKIHKVISTQDSFFNDLYTKEFYTNSSHHQAINKLANDFTVSAYCCDDNVIEAIAHKTKPIIAVQWHPERMFSEFYTENDVDISKLFNYFLSM